jgi:hypothetical protein
MRDDLIVFGRSEKGKIREGRHPQSPMKHTSQDSPTTRTIRIYPVDSDKQITRP